MQTKICTKCEVKKELSEFNKKLNGKFGVAYICKTCHSEQLKKHYQENKNQYFNRHKKYYQENKEKIAESSKKYYQQSKEKRRNHVKNYYQQNKEKLLSQRHEYLKNNRDKTKKYYQENKEKINRYNRKYYKENKVLLSHYKTIYTANRLHTDISFKILHNLRTRIRNAMKYNWKSKRTLELLGCSVEFLKNHLESKFQEGMTWENYGLKGWHIDHIIPCAKFDLTDLKQQEQCFRYTNLQPLWWYDNLSKWANIKEI